MAENGDTVYCNDELCFCINNKIKGEKKHEQETRNMGKAYGVMPDTAVGTPLKKWS